MYSVSVPSSKEAPGGHRAPLETTGDHRVQLPRTDFDMVRESSPLPISPGPQKLRLFGERKA